MLAISYAELDGGAVGGDAPGLVAGQAAPVFAPVDWLRILY
jgi:hypothetical protein